MLPISSFLFFVFSLSVGATQFDAKEFARLKGEWVIQGVIFNGEQLPAEEWKGKTVVFAESKAPLKASSMTYGGRLRTKGKMSWLETKTVATKIASKAAPVESRDEEYSGSYKIEGNTMKLLLLRVEKPNDRGPAGIAEHPDGKRGMLFFLKRKSSK